MLMRYAEKKEIRLYHQQYDGLKPIGGYTLPTLDYISRHEDTKIRVLDITDVEHSMRFNPIQYRYLPTLNKCMAMAENLLRAAYEENGKQTYHRLNLADSSIFSSPYFYLQQNDVVYVEPNQIRIDNSKYNQNNAYKLTVVSTIVSAVSVIASLVIALTVK